MADMENFMSLQGDTRADVALKDFINKRAGLSNEIMRLMSQKCVSTCEPYGQKASVNEMADENEVSAVTEFTVLEEQCLARCEAKVVKL